MTFGDEVEQRGWRCGSVVAPEMLPAVAPYLARTGSAPINVSAADWLIISSQTCDVVAQQREHEPLVEMLFCTPHLGKPRRGKRNLESTRHLDFRPNRETHPELVLTAHAVADRYVAPRELLTQFDPDKTRSLDEVASARILAWYALRAGRPSWPNAFCSRIRGANDALKLALTPLSEDVAEVRVAIAEKDSELPSNTPYHVAVFFIVDEMTWNGDIDGRQAIFSAFASFTSELNSCDGIELNEELSAVVPGFEFTWQELQQTDLWNFANLSHRDS